MLGHCLRAIVPLLAFASVGATVQRANELHVQATIEDGDLFYGAADLAHVRVKDVAPSDSTPCLPTLIFLANGSRALQNISSTARTSPKSTGTSATVGVGSCRSVTIQTTAARCVLRFPATAMSLTAHVFSFHFTGVNLTAVLLVLPAGPSRQR